jgi:hypothetical protein
MRSRSWCQSSSKCVLPVRLPVLFHLCCMFLPVRLVVTYSALLFECLLRKFTQKRSFSFNAFWECVLPVLLHLLFHLCYMCFASVVTCSAPCLVRKFTQKHSFSFYAVW